MRHLVMRLPDVSGGQLMTPRSRYAPYRVIAGDNPRPTTGNSKRLTRDTLPPGQVQHHYSVGSLVLTARIIIYEAKNYNL